MYTCLFSLLLCSCIGVGAVKAPVFTVEPPGLVEFSNSSGAVVPCQATGDPVPTVRWAGPDGGPLTSVAGLRELRADGSLVFPPFSGVRYRADLHRAVYHCQASSVLGTIRSRDARVRAVVDQIFEAHVSETYVVRGNTAILRCHAPGVEREFLKVMIWTRDDGVTLGSPGYSDEKYTVLSTGELLVRDALPSDTYRTYSCQLRNRISGLTATSSLPGKIIVREPHSPLPPSVTEARTAVTAREESRAELPCVAQGHPPPRTMWARQEGEVLVILQPSARIQPGPHSLVFQRLRSRDSGRYICLANNSLGQESAETKLIVTVPLAVAVEPETLTAELGRAAALRCRVAGHPVRAMTWLKDGRPLPPGRHRVLGREVLEIAPVQRDDRGMYQCLAAGETDSAQGAALLLIGEEVPTLLHRFQETVVRPGQSVSLKCSAAGAPLPQVTWSLDSRPVPESYNVRVGDYVSDERTVNSYVNVSSAGVEDGGIYACEARNEAGSVAHSSRLHVAGPPLVRPIGNVTVLHGRDLRITCPVAGYPIAAILWEKDGRVLPQDHRQKSFSNGTLTIQGVERNRDGGTYVCTARDPQGRSASRNMTLLVLAPPVVEPFAFPTDLTEGRRASVACVVAAGDLPIEIRWLKDGRPPGPDLRGHVARANDYTSLLSVPSVAARHAGNYTCLASNPAATASHSAPMVVHVPPQWKHEPTDKSAVMGHQVIFDCQSTGFPDPVIRWKKAVGGSADFQGIISGEAVQTLENGSLVVREARRQDSGRYMCQASNDVGPGLSRVVTLTVHVAAHFRQKFESKTVQNGQPLTLTCQAFGEKPISVRWRKDKHPFNPDLEPRYIFEEQVFEDSVLSTIRISSSSRHDSVLFSCFAENAYGKDVTNFQIVVQEVPDKPNVPEVSAVTSKSAMMTWMPPYNGNSPIVQLKIEFKPTPESWNRARTITAGPQETSHQLQGLSPQTSYEVRLLAVNVLGPGPPSEHAAFTTEKEAPNAPPRDIRVVALSSKSVHVTWKPPLSEDAPAVEGYYVGYRIRGRQEAYSYKTLEAGMREAKLTGLEKFTGYGVVVQAYNDKGAGPPSDEVLVKTFEYDAPNSPDLRLVSSTANSIQLAWENKESLNPITGYLIFHKEAAVAEWQEVQVSEERTGYTFRGLGCGLEYQFYIVAFNGAGRGAPGEMLTARTTGTPPVAPERQVFLTVNVSAVTLHLDRWQSGGCPLGHFRVQYRRRNSLDWVEHSSHVGAGTGPLTVTDLAPGTWYSLLVTAYNEAGPAEAEYLFATLTLAGATVPPLTAVAAAERDLVRHLKVAVPAVCACVAAVLLITLGCIVLLRRRRVMHLQDSRAAYGGPGGGCDQSRDDPPGKLVAGGDSVPMAVWEKRQQGSVYYPAAAYAASRVSLYGNGGGDDWSDPQHTYEVPFMPRQGNVPYSSPALMPPEDKCYGTTELEEALLYSTIQRLKRAARPKSYVPGGGHYGSPGRGGSEDSVSVPELSDAECDMPLYARPRDLYHF